MITKQQMGDNFNKLYDYLLEHGAESEKGLKARRKWRRTKEAFADQRQKDNEYAEKDAKKGYYKRLLNH